MEGNSGREGEWEEKQKEKWEEKQDDVTARNCKKFQALRIEIYTRKYSYDVIGEKL